jgi:hypothetical protein
LLSRRTLAPRCWWELLVFPAAVLAVHQLRYLLAYGSRAGAELSAHGDRYVGTAAAVALTLVAISLSLGLLRLAVVSKGGGQLPMAGRAPWLRWLAVTGLLLAGFCVIEGLEICFEAHHATGLQGIVGDGGWWALPAAALVGGLMVLLACSGRALRNRSVVWFP